MKPWGDDRREVVLNVAQPAAAVRFEGRLDEEVDRDAGVRGGRQPPLTGRVSAVVGVECKPRGTETIRKGLVEAGGQQLDVEP